MARLPDLVRFGAEHGLKIISIADLIAYRRAHETLVSKVAEATIPTPHGEFRSYAYESSVDGRTHVALVLGDIGDGQDVLTRVHSECLTGDVFASLRCDCGEQLQRSMEIIGDEGPRGRPVHPRPRGPGDRTDAQAARLRAAGPGPRHGRGEHRAGVPGRSARVRHRRADPGRPRRSHDAPAHEQPRQASRARGVRALHLRPHPDRDRADAREHRVPAHEAGEDGSPAGRPADDAPSPGRSGRAVSTFEGSPRGAGRRIAVVAARFNEVDHPQAGRRRARRPHGARGGRRRHRRRVGARRVRDPARRAAPRALRPLRRRHLPGRRDPRRDRALRSGRERGRARHRRRGSRDTGIPVIFEVLAVDDLAQAEDRAGGAHGNKGWEAAEAVALDGVAPGRAARRLDGSGSVAMGGPVIVDKPWGKVATYALNQPSSVRMITVEPRRRRASTTTGCATRCGWCSTPASRSRSATVWWRPRRVRSSWSRRRRPIGSATPATPGPGPRDRVRLHHRGRHPAPRRRLRAPARGGLVRRRRHPRRAAPILTGQQSSTCVHVHPRTGRPGACFSIEVMRGLADPTDQ